MVSKILTIFLDATLSMVVLFITAALSAWIAGFIVGSTMDASGQEELNGGAATSITILVICAAVTIAFAVWFYKFLNRRSKVIKEEI